jgi:predicted RNase H-like nuclease (RuvC/YqgF family)
LDISGEVVAALIGLMGTVGSGFITYRVTRKKATAQLAQCKEKYIDDKLREIIELYQNEVKQLREDVRKLTHENKLLREEIMDLKHKLLHPTDK